jgi:hypothetical protein
MTYSAHSSAQSKRRRDLDLIGILVVVGVVVLHTVQIFSPIVFYVKNAPSNWEEPSQLVAATFMAFFTLWGMPLMFTIAGMAIWYSLRKRSAGRFVRERVRRLLVPFAVGLFVFQPLNMYIAVKHGNPQDATTYLQFLPHFFDVRFDPFYPLFLKPGPGPFPFYLAHMWFLAYLFVYSLILLPLFLYLRKPAGRHLIERWAAFTTRGWAIYLMALPLAVIEAAVGIFVLTGGWNPYAYILLLAYGFLCAADARFEQAVRRHRKSALVLGILGFLAVMGVSQVLAVAGVDWMTDYSLGSVLVRFLHAMTGWFWIVAIVGLAGHAFHKQPANPGGDQRSQTTAPPSPHSKPPLKERIFHYAVEAQLPFYVLHLTPIVVIGSYVVQWEASVLIKFVVITLCSLAVTLLLYDVGVRRTRPTRFLFGMKPRR